MDLKMMSAVELAFVGDAVYELAVRRRIAELLNTTPNALHRLCVGFVNANAQHEALAVIDPMLTDEERVIARRGRNATKISVPKNTSPIIYREATAFEAVFGFIFLSGDLERVELLVDAVFEAQRGALGL